LSVVENDTGERLLIEAAQRDPTRFADLYEQNFERVYAYIAVRIRNRDEAQDLTAEVFHQALAGISRFEWRGAPFVTWLLGIAANILADRWERASKQPEVQADELERAGVDYKVEQRAMLFQLVDGLPEDQRHVILRRFVDQRSVREIARELGRSEGAVKQLQFRALQNLRTRIRSSHE
jgi:RNA polymerase sigma-70 factor, ECF subfamily